MRKNLKLKTKKGFTLTEVLVTVMIIIILSAMTIVNVPKYERGLKQLELDNVAKEIFIAAQNHLSMSDNLGYMGKTEFGTNENDYGVTEVAYGGTDSDVYFFLANGMGRNDLSNDSISLISTILPTGSIDESVRAGGSYIIRYQKGSGQILDVFYAETSGKFAHRFAASEYETLMSDYRDTDEVSKKQLRQKYGDDESVIGYYGGVAALGVASGSPLQPPVLDISNGDKLIITIQDKNYTWRGTDSSRAELQLVIKGVTSGSERIINLLDSTGKVNPDREFNDKAVNPITTTDGKTFDIVLDDISAEGMHFYDLFCCNDGGLNNFIPGENLEIRAISQSSTTFVQPVKTAKQTTNSLYGKLDMTEIANAETGITTINNTVQISSIRHLENLDNSISNVAIQVTNANQNADISWADYKAGANGSSTVIYKMDGTSSKAGSFIPVTPSKTAFTAIPIEYNGNGHAVQDVKIDCTGNAGLFSSLVSNSVVENLELVNFDITTSSGNAGALCGTATESQIIKVAAYNDYTLSADVESALEIKGSGYTGGLIGAMSDGFINSSMASVYVKSTGSAAGGFAGNTSGSTTIKNSYAAGHTSSGKYQDITEDGEKGRINVNASTYAGGFVGIVTGANTDVLYCYSTCSASGGTKSEGFVGYGTIDETQCYNTGGVPEDCEGYMNAEDDQTIAITYDTTLLLQYANKFSFYTIEQLNEGILDSEKTTFTKIHYGDWQIPNLSTLDCEVKNVDTLYIRIGDEEGITKYTVAITGQQSNYTKAFRIEIQDGTPVIVKEGYVDNDTNKFVWDDTVTTTVPIAMDGENIIITLDDITKAGRHFTELFADTSLIPGENIDVRVGRDHVTWKKLKSSGYKQSENSLFLYYNAGKIGGANISYVRHLQNLDPVISNVSDDVTTARLITNVNWSSTKYPKIFNADSSKSIDAGFYGIYNPNLTVFDGKNLSGKWCTIKGLPISAAPAAFSTTGAGNAGLFRLIDQPIEIKNVRLNEFSVTAGGSGHAGALAAQITGVTGDPTVTINSVLVSSEDKLVQAQGASYAAGGMIGLVDANVAISNSAATILVKSQGQAGGFIGRQDSGRLSLTECYTGGHTTGTKYSTSSYNVTSTGGPAGGIIAELNGGTFSLTRVSNAASVCGGTGKAAGGVIGQVVNYSAIPQMDYVYVIAPVNGVENDTFDNDKTGSEATYAGVGTQRPCGAFIGTIASGKSVSNTQNTYYLPEVYEGAVTFDNVTPAKSSIAYVGKSAGNMNLVRLAYYDRDGATNAISAKTYQTTMQLRTHPYDSALLENNNDGKGSREYPFAIWTSFAFEDRIPAESTVGGQRYYYGTYFGDWQPVLESATVAFTVTFKYSNPLLGGLVQNVPDANLGTQSLFKLKDNKLLVPYVANISGYELKYWELDGVKDSDNNPVQFEPNNGWITIPAEYCTKDRVVVAHFERIQTEGKDNYSVAFYYDNTGANENFQLIGRPQLAVAGTTKYSDIVVPVRNIAEYQLVGWYTDRNFDESTKIEFDSNSLITGDVVAFAKYEEIDYYTVTVDFMFQIDGGTVDHLNSVPRYRITDEQSQYRLTKVVGTEFNDDIALPVFSNNTSIDFSSCSISTGKYDEAGHAVMNEGGSNPAPDIQLSSDKKTIHIETDDTENYMVVYHVSTAASSDDVYTYKIRYIMHDTDSARSSEYDLVYRSGDEYSYFKTFSGGKQLFEEQIGNVPDIKFEALEGWNRITNTVVLRDVDKSTYGCDYIIDVEYSRRTFTLAFDSRAGSYVEPILVPYGAPLSEQKPDVNPARRGYKFNQWIIHSMGVYEDSEGSLTYNSDDAYYFWNANGETDRNGKPVYDTMPAKNLEATAKWDPDYSNYRVMFWYENADNDDYSYKSSFLLQELTGTQVSSSLFSDAESLKNSGKSHTHNINCYDGVGEAIKTQTETHTSYAVTYRFKANVTNVNGKKANWSCPTLGITNASCSRSKDKSYYPFEGTSGSYTLSHSGITSFTYYVERTIHITFDDSNHSGNKTWTCLDPEFPTLTGTCSYDDGGWFSSGSWKLNSDEMGSSDAKITNQSSTTSYLAVGGRKINIENKSDTTSLKVHNWTYDDNPSSGGKCIYYNSTWYLYTGSKNAGEKLEPNCIYDSIAGADFSWVDSTHFVYNGAKGEVKTVNGEGTTILNVYFDRVDYTFTFNNGSKDIYSFTAKYQEDIRNNWTFKGSDNVNYPYESGSEKGSWKAESSKTYTERLTQLVIMPGENIRWKLNKNSNSTRYYYYYVEALGTEANIQTRDGKGYVSYLEMPNDFNIMTYNEDFFEFNGFKREFYAKDSFTGSKVTSTSNASNSSNQKIYFFYSRNSYKIDFIVAGKTEKTENVKYEASLASFKTYVPSRPAGIDSDYTFSGWFYDEGYSKPVDFNTAKMPYNNLVLFGRWTPPSYDVHFYKEKEYINDGIHSPWKEVTGIEKNTSIDDEVANAYGILLPEYTPSKTGYVFDGWWYNDGVKDKPFIISQYITGETNLYAHWTKEEDLIDTTERRDVKVNYLFIDDEDNVIQLASSTNLNGKAVGDTLMVRAKDIAHYYPDNMVYYHPVAFSDDITDNTVNFYYTYIEPWEYTVDYYVHFSNYEVDEEEIRSAVTISADEDDLNFYIGSETFEAYDQYSTIQLLMPTGYEDYTVNHYEYDTTKNGTGSIVTIHPDGSKTAHIDLFIEPDKSKLSVGDRFVTYNGDTQALKQETVTTTDLTSELNIELINMYRYYGADKKSLTDDKIVDAGAYRMNGYRVLKVTGIGTKNGVKESASKTRYYLLWKDTDKTLNLRIGRRPITITSAGATAEYNPTQALTRSNPETDITYTYTGTPDGKGAFVNGQGVDISFSVEAFRDYYGESDNSFTYTFWDGTKAGKAKTEATNYEVTTVYGTLKVTGTPPADPEDPVVPTSPTDR